MIVVSIQLSVDPAEAQCRIDGLRFGKRPRGRTSLRQLEPDGRHASGAGVQPRLEGGSIGEGMDW